MRKVSVYEYTKPTPPETKCRRAYICEAIFHQFGVAYEEFENGPGNYSTAIVEYDDGSVGNVPVELIEFILGDL